MIVNIQIVIVNNNLKGNNKEEHFYERKEFSH